jgi:hypothetical protein
LGQSNEAASDESTPLARDIRDDGAKIFPQRNIHIWKRYVRDFRRDHHFAIVVGGARGSWKVSKFGTIHNQSFASKGFVTRAQYSFHLPIFRGFGYLLGSTCGYEYEITDEKVAFQPKPAYEFPTLLVGLAYNFTPGVRTAISVDYGISRMEEVEERDSRSGRLDGLPDDPIIGVTLTTLDLGWSTDYFVGLNWAIRFDAHWRLQKHAPPKKLAGQAIDADFRKDDRWLGLGLVFHLL